MHSSAILLGSKSHWHQWNTFLRKQGYDTAVKIWSCALLHGREPCWMQKNHVQLSQSLCLNAHSAGSAHKHNLSIEWPCIQRYTNLWPGQRLPSPTNKAITVYWSQWYFWIACVLSFCPCNNHLFVVVVVVIEILTSLCMAFWGITRRR